MGWKPDELIGTYGFDLLHPDDRARLAEGRAAFYAEEAQLERIVGRFRMKDESYIVLSGTARPVVDEGGERKGIVFGAREVEELLDEVERWKSELGPGA